MSERMSERIRERISERMSEDFQQSVRQYVKLGKTIPRLFEPFMSQSIGLVLPSLQTGGARELPVGWLMQRKPQNES